MCRFPQYAPTLIRETVEGGLIHVNRPFREFSGFSESELSEKPLIQWIHPEDRDRFLKVIKAGKGQLFARHRLQSGEWKEISWNVRESATGSYVLGRFPTGGAAPSPTWAPIGPASAITNTLESIVRFVESKHPGIRSSVLILGESGRISVGAGPSLPSRYNQAVEGLAIGPTVGSCGTAVYWNLPVVVEDVKSDPLWANLKDHAIEAGLHACWSHPITSFEGNVLGALAFYAPESRGPTHEEFEGLKTAARMVGLAVERLLSESESRAQSQLLGSVTDILTYFVDSGDWHSVRMQLIEAAMNLVGCRRGFFGELEGEEWSVYSQDGRKLGNESFMKLQLNALLAQMESGEGPTVVHLPKNRATVKLERDSGDPFLMASLRHGGTLVGFIAVTDSERDFTPKDCNIAQALSKAASVTLDNYVRRKHETELEQQLLQAGKMEALGVMAGGVAHDFNNMLAIVMGNAELAMTTLPKGNEAIGMLEEILTATRRASELCSQMLAYAGRGTFLMECMEINQMILEIGGLLSVTLSKKARIEYGMSERPLHVHADKTQMRRVIMNLVTNASDALGSDEGQIEITTDACSVSGDAIRVPGAEARLKPGRYVKVMVADTGCGMTPETMTRIFDPFFTTKFSGRGLGLAAVRGIIESHGGVITLESTLGSGTKFTILLPFIVPTAEKTRPDQSATQEPVYKQEGKRILLIDDDEDLRRTVGRILERAGFVVDQASDGDEALEMFRSNHDSIDGVITDLSMPKMDGVETFRALRKIAPNIAVILNSGYLEADIKDRYKAEGFSSVLQKPVSSKVLLKTLNQVLAQTGRGDANGSDK